MSLQLSIIVLSFNTKNLLESCLKSLNTHPSSSEFELIVVDNASSDGSAEMVSLKFPHAKLVRLQSNGGFSRGNNAGIKVAKGKYIMLLNSDTQVTSDAIDQLLEYLDSNPGVGIITPKVILPDGAIDLACHRGMPTPWNAFTYFTRLESLFPSSKLFGGYHQTWQDFSTTHPIDATAATAIIVRKSALDQVGLLDEQFFLYAEDLDWCQRFTTAGWQIIYFPSSVVLHHKSASGKRVGQGSQDKEVKLRRRESANHFYDTMKQFYEKHYTTKYPRWLRHLVYLGIDLKKKFHH